MHEIAIQARLRRDLGTRYTSGLWKYLQGRGFVSEAVDGATGYENVLNEARLILACQRDDPPTAKSSASPSIQPPASGVVSPTPGQERALALSKLLWHDAKSDPDVMRFREHHMNGELVGWEDIEIWLSKRRNEDGPLTTDITIALPADAKLESKWQPEVIAAYLSRSTGVSYRSRVLAYAVPGDDGVRRMTVRAGGTLDILRRLSGQLASIYGWMEAQATVHVLTGIPAFVAPVRSTAPAINIRHGWGMPGAQRIILNVDSACTPEDLLVAFQRVRQQLGLDRLRPLSTKHLRLAAFACADHADKSWAERHQLWNRTFPDWAYAASSNFRRDAIRAEHQVMYPGRFRGGAPLRRPLANDVLDPGDDAASG